MNSDPQTGRERTLPTSFGSGPTPANRRRPDLPSLSQDVLDALLAQYTGLYDFAPAGYLTLDRDGVIRKQDVPGALRPALGDFVPALSAERRPRRLREEGRDKLNLRELTEQVLLEHYVQAGVLVNGRGEILHIADQGTTYERQQTQEHDA